MRSISRACGVLDKHGCQSLVDAGLACTAFHDETVPNAASKVVECTPKPTMSNSPRPPLKALATLDIALHRNRRSVLAARTRRLLRDFVLGDSPFESRDVFKQALAGQHEEVVTELRILKVDFEQLFISDGENVPGLRAFDRRRPPVVG